MPNSDKPRRASLHVEPKDSPDERLKRELLRIESGDYEGPEQRAHARSQAIAERLRLELPRLADIARVPSEPPHRRDHFQNAVRNVVLDAWENDDSRKTASALPVIGPALSQAVDELRSAKRSLARLDQGDREALWWPISQVEGGIDRLEMMLGITKLTNPQRGAEPTHPRLGPGKPAGTITDWPFQIFVRDLLRAANSCGGKLTLDQNRGTGTLLDAIDVFRPCLPERLVPKALPLKTMQKIKTKVGKRR